MRCIFNLVGQVNYCKNIDIDLQQIPRVGDVINVKGISQGHSVVRTVVWYLEHDDDGTELAEPFVYIVIGNPLRRN